MSEAVTADKVADYESNKVHIEAPAQWLKKGWGDFKRAPGVGISYGLVFVLAGYGMFVGFQALGLSYLILPVSGSFILFAPWLALGLYEVSRQLELDQKPTFMSTYGAWKYSPRRLGIMAFILLMIMLVWTMMAVVLYALMMGNASLSLENMSVEIFTSTEGLVFLAVGSMVRMFFAALTFLITAVSVPMILDTDIDVFAAISFSFNTVLKNSHVMWSWAFTIGIFGWFGIATFFVGLVIVMPVLGYASWHAYRDLVNAEQS